MKKTGLFPFFGGLLMGAADVIPGVSGGTIAFLLGLFERLVKGVSSFDRQALRLLFQRRWRSWARHTDFFFLLKVLTGIALSIITIAHVLKQLFEVYRTPLMGFFFGLIAGSVYFVFQRVRRYSPSVVLFSLLGVALAAGIAFLPPAQENRSIFYLILCGMLSITSMMLPGISGSFILLLLGNYQLVFLHGVVNFDLFVLLPLGLGCLLGVFFFSRLISWVFQKYHDQTTGLLSGFVAGSLTVIWPWKEETLQSFNLNGTVKTLVRAYDYYLPSESWETFRVAIIALGGALLVILIELLAHRQRAQDQRGINERASGPVAQREHR